MRTYLTIGLFCGAVPLMAGFVNPVPEPATMFVVGGGLAALILVARKRQNRGKK